MTAAPSFRARSVLFGDLPDPVRFTGCDDLVDAVRSILRGWDVRDARRDGLPAPAIRVTRTRQGYRRVSCWTRTPSRIREKTRRSLVEALCGFHFELIDWYLERHPEMLFVHGAAVRYGRRLVLFPALAKAGKSTLTVHLAMRGRRVWCDDVLPIDTRTRRGIALGIVPRLRPPLPSSLGREFHAFVAARRGHERKNRLYVDLRPREMARLGESAPVRGVVLLERRPRARAALLPVDPAEALERIVLQQFAREVPAPAILDTLAAVVEGARCHALRYSSVDAAAKLLDQAFGGAS